MKEISDLKARCEFLETRNQDNAYRFAQIESQLQQFLSYSGPGQQPAFAGNSYGNGIGYANATRSDDKVRHHEKPINKNALSKASLPRHPNAKDLPDTIKCPSPPNAMSGRRQASLDLDFMRGFSTYDLPVSDDHPIMEMTPFEEKMLTSALADGPLPTDEDRKLPHRMQSRRVARPPDMERQVSTQFRGISLDDFPPLSMGLG